MENHDRNLIGNRLRLIMEYLGLEIAGFEEFSSISSSHLYAILNGTRRLTGEIANKLGERIGLEGWKILHVDYEISANIRHHLNVIKFYKEYKSVPDYFIDTVDDRKKSHFINQLAKLSSFFDQERYVWEVNEVCKEAGRKYHSKELSQILRVLCDKGILNREKRQYKSKTGLQKDRLVWVYFKP